MSEVNRRYNVVFHLRAVVASFGGQMIVNGEPMEDMIRQLADRAEQLAQDGYLKVAREDQPHLQYETSERGFMSLPAIPSSYGGQVRVYESSTAERQYVWLNAVAPKNLNNPTGDTVTAPIHLTVENAKALGEQLLFLVDEHYQGSDDDEYDEDDCSACGDGCWGDDDE